jgi:hypothetical protein
MPTDNRRYGMYVHGCEYIQIWVRRMSLYVCNMYMNVHIPSDVLMYTSLIYMDASCAFSSTNEQTGG